MDQSSHEYEYRDGVFEERTLMVVSSGVFSTQNGIAEVSFHSVYLQHTIYALGSDCFPNVHMNKK